MNSRIQFGKDIHKELTDIASWEAVKGMMAEKRAANPGKPQMELFGYMEMGSAMAAISADDNLKKFARMAETKPEYVSAMKKKAMNGELGNSMKVKVDPVNLKSEFSMNVKYNAKREKKDERIREIVSETTAKKAREQRDKEREAAQKAQQKQAPKGSSRGRK